MKFIHINLHHSKDASALLCQELALGKVGIALIQKPWLQGDQLRSLGGTDGTVFLEMNSVSLRSHVRIQFNVLLLVEFCSRDVAMARKAKETRGRLL
jgi:hypothetical protein